jgi:hypothetical protein
LLAGDIVCSRTLTPWPRSRSTERDRGELVGNDPGVELRRDLGDRIDGTGEVAARHQRSDPGHQQAGWVLNVAADDGLVNGS